MTVLEYIVLTEGPAEHHVVIRREGSEWLQRVATFPIRERAADYAEFENDFTSWDDADSKEWAATRYEAIDTPPTIPAPPSAIKPENFVAKAPEPKTEPIDIKVNEPEQAAATSSAPSNEAAKIIDPIPAGSPAAPDRRAGDLVASSDAAPADQEAAKAPEPARRTPPAPPATVERVAGTNLNPAKRNGADHDPAPIAADQPPKPKPVASSQPNGRDPLLAREQGLPPSGKIIPPDQHHGSQGQQLADRIVRDLPTLMRMHLRGPTRSDLTGFYRATAARVDEAVRVLFVKQAIRLDRPNGGEQHIVPHDWPETPAPADDAERYGVDRAARKQAILATLRAEAHDGVVALGLAEIATRTGIPLGSMNPLMAALVRDGALAVVKPQVSGTRAPAQYRITEPERPAP